jgi:hypothetical protein
MHDIDRTQMENIPEMEDFEQEPFEYGEAEWEAEDEWRPQAGVFNDAEAMELASELLDVASEGELDNFLGDLIKSAGQAVGQFIRSPVGQQIGSLLKGALKKALPTIGSAIGGYFGGPAGAQMGSQAATTAGQIFGLELEGLSPEDQEFETAKRFVQFAGEVAKNAASGPPEGDPQAIAHSAALAAAHQLAPGFVAGASVGMPAWPCRDCRRRSSGRWIRHGRQIILLGA